MKNRKNLYGSISMLAAFVLWTIAVRCVDVGAIGPNGTSVGFAAINGLIHRLTGVHMLLYHITDWLGLVPIFTAFGFALLGLVQWIKRKRLRDVDYSLFILGGVYIAVTAVYLLFEIIPINYRPVLIGGSPEASYPSSTTLLVMCVMPTAIMQLNSRIGSMALKKWLSRFLAAFTVFMVAGRLISGVHWFTDIVGGMLLSAGFVMLYRFFAKGNKA